MSPAYNNDGCDQKGDDVLPDFLDDHDDGFEPPPDILGDSVELKTPMVPSDSSDNENHSRETTGPRSFIGRLASSTRAKVLASAVGIFLVGVGGAVLDRSSSSSPDPSQGKASTFKMPKITTPALKQNTGAIFHVTPIETAPQKAPEVKAINEEETVPLETFHPLKNKREVVEKYSKVPGLSHTEVAKAYDAVSDALKWIKSDKKLLKKLKKHDIELGNPEFYLAIAIKESALDPKAGEDRKYKGYFQLRMRPDDPDENKTAVKKKPPEKDRSPLKDIEQFFDINFGNKELLQPRENAISGILYYHLCRDRYLGHDIPEADKDLSTYFSYNVGQGAFMNIWDSLGATSYEDFEIKLSKLLADKAPDKIKYNDHPYEDKTYGISYRVHLELIDSTGDLGSIVIGGSEYDVGKLFRAMRYARTIDSLAHDDPDENFANK